MTDHDIIHEYNERYQQANDKLQEFREKAQEDVEFYLGKQFTDAELSYLARNDREAVINNKIRRAVELVSGWQRSNRMSTILLPFGEDNQLAADQLSNAVQWVYTKRYGYHHVSDCFQYGSLISGINFSEIMLDWTDDLENPDISFARIPYNAVVWDPYFTKIDMSDCQYLVRRKYVSKAEAASLLPDLIKDIESMSTGATTDHKFPEMPFSSNPNSQEMLTYDEYWYRCLDNRDVLVNTQTDAVISEIRKENKEKAQTAVSMIPFLKIVKRRKSVVKLAVIINGQLMMHGDDPLMIDDYPFVPFIGFYVPEYDDYTLNIQSFIRSAKDPQRELNKRISKALDIMDKKIHVGHYYKPSKLFDQQDPFIGGNFQNIALKDEAIIGQDIQPIPAPQMDQSIIQMSQIMDNNLMEVLGLNDATFGVPNSGSESGLLTMIRQSASMYSLQPLFDNLNQSQYIHGKKVAKTIQKWWKPQKVQRVINDQPSPQFYDSTFTKYDVCVSQGVQTETQQKLFFAQLMQLRQMGIQIPDSIIIKYAPLQAKGKLEEQIAQIEQQGQQQAMVEAQLKMQNQKMVNDLLQSETEENQAQTIRANASALGDIALTQSRLADADAKRTSATVDAIMAAQKISESEQTQFMDAVNFVRTFIDAARQNENGEFNRDRLMLEEESNAEDREQLLT